MARKVKKQEHEKLDDVTIGRVVQLLEQEKPITKKAACEMLNITYNTTRLNRIIEQWKGEQDYKTKRRKALRGKPFDEHEIRYTVLNYLKGDSIAAIAEAQFRTVSGVKKVLEKYGIPARDSSHNYFNPTDIPDESVAWDFEDGELVWSARYNCVAQIQGKWKDTDPEMPVYKIWVFGKHNEGALQACYDLAKLPILKELGCTPDDFEDYDTKGLFYSIR